jgi:rifampicin phosphotransferase
MDSMSLRLLDLRELDPVADQTFGGKAAGLARLIRSGAQVPAGFAVEARRPPWTAGERDAVVARARALLSSGPVAVRSSAVGEDAADRSFAGLFETVLDVRDGEALLAAAVKCLASGDSERARAYGSDGLPVGIVVQSMVAARAAGVCFTADPAGRDGAVLIEAVAGRGDALVSGRVQPQAWRVYERPAEFEPHGVTGAIRADEAAALAREARGLERAFGRPLDLEWAIDEAGRRWWLQARPITALRPATRWDVERFFDGVDDGPVSVWSNWNVREVVREPFAPLPWGLWRETVLPMVVMPMLGLDQRAPLFLRMIPVDLVHGRLYWNMNALLAIPGLGALVPRLVGRLDARAGRMVARLRQSGVLTRRRLPGFRLALHARAVAATLRKMGTTFSGETRPRQAMRALEACGAVLSARPDPPTLSDGGLLEELRLFARPDTAPLRRGQQAMGAVFAAWVAAERAFRDHPDALRLLAAGASANPTTQISVGISRLTESARDRGLDALFREPAGSLRERLAAGDDGRAWLGELQAFLDRFGHRCPNEFDLTAPRWTEDPSMILELVRAGLAAPPGETMDARLARLSKEREAAIASAIQASSPWRRPLMRFLARQVVDCMPLREAPKHYAMLAFLRLRLAALELGRRLVAQGLLERADDVMFLEWGEAQSLARGEDTLPDLPAAIAARRARHARHRAERPPDVLRSDGVPEDDHDAIADAGTMHGLGASGGRARGPVRVLRTPDASSMRDGDVLVVEYADPGWTPLFPRAAALVMEVGGAMCHAAVVARELGVPAVFGVSGATHALRDGTIVEVDGDRGVVTEVRG